MKEMAVIVQTAQAVCYGQQLQFILCLLKLGREVHDLLFQMIAGLLKFFLRSLALGIKQSIFYGKGNRRAQTR